MSASTDRPRVPRPRRADTTSAAGIGDAVSRVPLAHGDGGRQRIGNQTVQLLLRAGRVPTGVLLEHRSAVGNRVVLGVLQAQRRTPAASASSWASRRTAVRTARARGDDREADRLTRQAIAAAATGATYPAAIPRRLPTPDDILLDPMTKADAHAQTRPKEIPAHPTDYWRWLSFTPQLIAGSEAQVQSVITHELVHVAQFTAIWNAYEKDTSPGRPSWDEFLKPHQARRRVEGPEELQAHATSLDFLDRLAPGEQVVALRGLFSSFVATVAYVPPAGEAVAITAAEVGPKILTYFRGTGTTMRQRMGSALWWSLMDVGPAKATFVAVLTTLRPVALAGYADPALRPVYDDLLAAEGIGRTSWR
ncbi:hypothetical protein [Agromyces bauzanensis]